MSSEFTSLITFVESYLTWRLSALSGELAAFTLLIAFAVLSALELNYPKRRLSLKQLHQSYQTNFSLFIFNSIVISLLSAAPLLMVAEHYSGRRL
ncbi:MAG: fatty acid hydroxylase, partial [Methylobacter sp.]